MSRAVALSRTAEAENADVRTRILRQARRDFFAHGYSTLTMDALAAELGMSKKTLYLHFSGKEDIVGAVIEDLAAEIRGAADELHENAELSVAEKLRRFMEGLLERMAALTPRTVRDLQRFAPQLYARVEEVRGKTLPYVFGRFIAEGQAAGLVHAHLPPGFAIEFFLQAVQGMMQPDSLERLQLAPRDVIRHAVALFFGGVLTNTGRKHYEKQFPR